MNLEIRSSATDSKAKIMARWGVWRKMFLGVLIAVFIANGIYFSSNFTCQEERLFQAQDSSTALPTRNTLTLLLCNSKYCPAVADLILSLRNDGGYTDDVAVIVDESANYTTNSLRMDIIREGGGRNESLKNVFFWTAQELLDDLQLDNEKKYLKETPPMASCGKEYSKVKHRAYYLKSLMFHPVLVKWKRVLYMDGCMTIHSPHIHEVLSLPEAEGHMLASPDPWYWGRNGISAKFVSCPDPNTTRLIQELVGTINLKEVRYFASGLVLFDTAILREYGDSPTATLVELLTLYHRLAGQFHGDQEILSIYWVYVRKSFRVMPLAMFESNRVPYEFVNRVRGDPHIITAGHKTRRVCFERSTNNRTI